ncbi:MAG: tyrosine--tRNA ligase [Parcubacteria group bacterium]
MKINTDEKLIEEFLSRNAVEIVVKDSLREKLRSGRQLRIKFGVDVTNPMLHLGHAVNLWKMRELQELGHKVVFLIGDFTSLIGDPTGKSKARPKRTSEQIDKDAKEYRRQVLKVLLSDSKVFEERRNSEWYKKMRVNEFLDLMAMLTHGRLIQRDMFQKRIKDGEEIYMNEMLYPMLQGYDSVMLESDLTVIGNDQLFNELMGRFYQERFGQKPQDIMTTIITPGIDGGEKMSKSIGNFVAITDEPEEKFGKLMSIADNLIVQYLQVYTKLPFAEIGTIEDGIKAGQNPRDAKMRLAFEVVKMYHGEKVATEAQENFINKFQKKETPDEMPEFDLAGRNIVEALSESKLTSSNGEARRLIEQKGVKINDTVVESTETVVKSGDIIKKGKRFFIRIK